MRPRWCLHKLVMKSILAALKLNRLEENKPKPPENTESKQLTSQENKVENMAASCGEEEG